VADGVHATVDNRQAMSMCSMLRHGSRRFYLKVEERRDMRRLHFSPTQRLLCYYYSFILLSNELVIYACILCNSNLSAITSTVSHRLHICSH
jgi:hypothetical protein